MNGQIIEVGRGALHHRVDQLLRAVDGVAVVERSVEALGEPEVCLPQGEDAVEKMLLTRHPTRSENLVGRGDLVVSLLVIEPLPWPRDAEVLQQGLIIAVKMWLLGPPVERQIVPLTPSCAGNLG